MWSQRCLKGHERLLSRGLRHAEDSARRSSRLMRPLTTASSSTHSKVIFSGIQPTGVPHLGNYLGALKRWKELQDESDDKSLHIYSLVDLHAITVPQDVRQLRQWRRESLAVLLAIGLDPSRSIIFYQGDVAAHSELMWILSCYASTGYLSRMTQWKDKAANERENSEKAKLGLFSYPVLMAADVLVHGTTYVPVGHDQAQHLEFTREIAQTFNHAVGKDVFRLPETIMSPAKRIMSLTDPVAKMSKSHSNIMSRISLTDTETLIRKKIAGAVTDSKNSVSYDPERRPGVSNLLDILFHSGAEPGFSSPRELARDMQGQSLRALKDRVATGVEAIVRPVRERYAAALGDSKRLTQVAAQGAERARENSAPVMRAVKQAVGLT